MCRTSLTTHLLCLHTTSSTQHCPLHHRIITLSLFRRHVPITSTTYTNTFCPPCRLFWDLHSVSPTVSRDHATNFRIENQYYGAMIPRAEPKGEGKGWVFGFVKCGDGVEGDGVGRDARYVCELNAHWEVDDYGPVAGLAERYQRGSQRGRGETGRQSGESGCTVWPGSRTESSGGEMDEGRTESSADLEEVRELIDPGRFEMEKLMRELRNSTDAWGLDPILGTTGGASQTEIGGGNEREKSSGKD